MIILDTNHVRVLQQGGPAATQLLARLRAADQDVALTIITVEEMIRGWMAAINKATTPDAKVPYYARLAHLVTSLTAWPILSLDMTAALIAKTFRTSLRRISMSDLLIGAIVIRHDALLLSANLRDFQQIPGVQMEIGTASRVPLPCVGACSHLIRTQHRSEKCPEERRIPSLVDVILACWAIHALSKV